MPVNLADLSAQHNVRWRSALISPNKVSDFAAVARRLCASEAKHQYQEIEADTKVPWYVVAVIHERESSQNWMTSIAQGDPWNKKSVHVPAGRGPFASFRAAASDALVNCAPRAARWTDWSIGGALTLLEQYNGLGYASRGLPSPYIWAGTNQYLKGKYVSDGKFDPEKVDTQLGCAGLLKAMQQVDSTIQFKGQVANAPVARVGSSNASAAIIPATHAPNIQPSISSPAAGSLGDFIKKWLA